MLRPRIFGTKGCLFYSGDDAEPSSGHLELLCHDGSSEAVPGFRFENTELLG